MADKWFYPILFFLLFVHSYPAAAGSVQEFVAKGNEAYEKGNYDEALAAYEKAAKESPESARVFFNLGTAFYQKGEYAKAIEAFKQAALKSKDTELEADSQYNLGNSSFRAAEQQKTGDLHQALESYEKSVEFYREALERFPDFTEAAENMEMARLVMKSILEEIQQKEEASQKQQKAPDELQKALDSLQDNRENDQQQEQKPDEDGRENNDQDDGEAIQGQQEEPGKESESQEQYTPEGVDAAAIIDEERENMKNRRQRSAAGYKGVERDW